MRFRSLSLLSLVLIAATACGDDTTSIGPTPDPIVEAFLTAEATWAAAALQSYHFTHQNTGFAGPDGAYRITVVDGAIARVFDVDQDALVSPEAWSTFPSVDDLFAQIEATFEDSSTGLEAVTYDSATGVPLSAEFVNPSEGWGFVVSDFEALETERDGSTICLEPILDCTPLERLAASRVVWDAIAGDDEVTYCLERGATSFTGYQFRARAEYGDGTLAWWRIEETDEDGGELLITDEGEAPETTDDSRVAPMEALYDRCEQELSGDLSDEIVITLSFDDNDVLRSCAAEHPSCQDDCGDILDISSLELDTCDRE